MPHTTHHTNSVVTCREQSELPLSAMRSDVGRDQLDKAQLVQLFLARDFTALEVLGKSLYFELLVEDLGNSRDVLSAFKVSGFQPSLL